MFLGPGGSAPISIDGNNRLLSVSQENGTINLWEIQTGNKIRTLRHDGQVMAMRQQRWELPCQFDRDGNRIYLGLEHRHR